VRILLVSQFWPGPDDPDLGVFVAQLAAALERRGHVVDRAVVDHRRPGKAKHAKLLRDAVAAARRARPDVVFAHFLVPAGAAGAAAAALARAPLVVMAHGQDVRNAARAPVRAATRAVVARAHTVIANSAYLRDELDRHVPGVAAKSVVADCGVDLERFAVAPAPPADATDGPVFLYVGGLHERKNVVRLRDAFLALGRGELLVVGDGPLRAALSGRPGITLAGAVPHDEVPAWIARAHVLCLPSLVEPFGQVLLEAMACGRPVVATRVGGPPEFVPEGGGVLVDPLDTPGLTAALARAGALPVPNAAARAAAEAHGLERQADRMEEVLLAATSRAASSARTSSSSSSTSSS